MKKRKVSSILLSLALAASLFTGCGGAEPAAGTETTPDAETEAAETETAPDTEAAAGDSGYKTTGEAYEIHYIARSNEDGTQMQALYEIIDMYQKQVNPNFSMNIECISDQQTHNQKIRTLAAAMNFRIGGQAMLIPSSMSYGMQVWSLTWVIFSKNWESMTTFIGVRLTIQAQRTAKLQV